MGNVIAYIRKELKQSIDEKTQKNSQYFFKEKGYLTLHQIKGLFHSHIGCLYSRLIIHII